MNKFLIILIITLVSSSLKDSDTILFQQFQKFIKKYNKKYNSMTEFLTKFEIFKQNVKSSFKENVSYNTGITKFSDLTQQEFNKIYSTMNYNDISANNFIPKKDKFINAAPDSWDWRDQGYVPPIYDSGSCGAFWAITTLDHLSFFYYRYKSEKKQLSAQLLIDCDTSDSGCNGGSITTALTWIKSHGIMFEADYPYTGTKGTCKSDSSKYIDMIITGYKKFGSTTSPADEDEMKEFLYENGPLIVGLNGTPLQTYTGGIIDVTSSQCPASGINIYALLVGYGYDSTTGKNYWIVKNVWGSSWGEKGYFRIKRGSGTCGINTYVMTGTVSF